MFGAGCLRNPHASSLIHGTPKMLMSRLRILAQWCSTRNEKKGVLVGEIPDNSHLMSNGASPVLLSTSWHHICDAWFKMCRWITLPQIAEEPRIRERQDRQTWEVRRVTVSPFVVNAGSCPGGAASDRPRSTTISSFRSALNKKIRQISSSCNFKMKGSSAPSEKFWVTGRWAMGKKRYQECMNLARAEFGNTLTRHVGVPSWVFTPLLTYTYYHYLNPHTFPRLGPFFPFPTHPLLYYHLISFPTTRNQPGRGGSVEWGSSAHSIDLRPVEQLTTSRLLPRTP